MSALQVVDTEDTTGTQLPVSQTLMAHSVSLQLLAQLHFVTQLQLRKEKLINRKVYSILPGEAGEISFLALRMSGAIMVSL